MSVRKPSFRQSLRRSRGVVSHRVHSLVGAEPRRTRPAARRRMNLESLESRQLFAADVIPGLNDEFDDPSSIADWQRVEAVEGWGTNQLNRFDIDTTQPGRMVQQPHTVVWYEDWRGPMAFQEVTGDFVFTTQVHVTDRDDVGGSDPDDVPGDAQFSLAGAMIRTPRGFTDPSGWAPGSHADDGTNSGENYVFLSLGYAAGPNEFSLEVKTTRNSTSQLELTSLGPTANVVNVQLARIGNSVIALYQLPGQAWQVHRRYSRPDMPATLQVGLVSYSDWGKASDYAPAVHNATTLIPGQVANPTPSEPFNPDLTAGFEYARYVRPDVPQGLAGLNLADPNQVPDGQLLAFLGEAANLVETVVTPPPATATVTGTVFDDVDGDGVRDTAPLGSEFQFVVYQDELIDDWQIENWNATVDAAAPAPGGVGNALAMSIQQSGYVNLRWRGVYGRTLTDYDHLSFRVHGGNSGGQTIRVAFGGTGEPNASGAPVWWHGGPYLQVPAGGWTDFQIPLDQFSPLPEQISSIMFLVESDQPTFYVDQISLVGTGNDADYAQVLQIANHPNAGEVWGGVVTGESTTAGPNWGVNLGFHADWGFEAAWVDVSKTWRDWGLPDSPWVHPQWTLPLTDQGIPREDFGSLMMLRGYPEGVYRLRFEGTAELGVSGVGGIVPGSLRVENGVTYADVQVLRPERDVWPEYQNGPSVFFAFRGVDAANPVRNIRMLAPGYDWSTTQVFRDEYLHRLQPFSTLRFMQWTNTVFNLAEQWDLRRLPTETIQAGWNDARGSIAWEYAAYLANEAGKDAWINVPHLANDDYIRQLARTMHDTLDPERRLYVEFSNELWNWEYQATHVVQSDFYQVVAPRLHRISEIFREEFADRPERLQVVLAVQAAWDVHAVNALRWFDDQGLRASDFIDSLAIAPYFGVDSAGPYSQLDQIAAEMPTMEFQAWMTRQHRRIAEDYGLELISYEGGPHFTPWNATDPALAYQVQAHPQMGEAYDEYVTMWEQNAGHGLFMQYQFLGDHWGLLEDLRDPGSVKWDSLLSHLLPAGDATLDCSVDFSDFAVLRSHFGEGPGSPLAANALRSPGDPTLRWWEQGDFDRDNAVLGTDLQLLYAHLDLTRLSAAEHQAILSFAQQHGVVLPANVGSTCPTVASGSGNSSTGVEPGLAGVTVYADLNRNGQRDLDEPTTVTDPAGSYTLGSLPTGEVVIRVVAPTDWTVTYPQDASHTLQLAAGGATTDVSFGLHRESLAAKPELGFSLEVVDSQGNAVTTAEVGEPLWLRVEVEDLRTEALGVFAAFTDLSFDGVNVEFTGNPLLGEDFPNYRVAAVGAGQWVDEIGGMAGTEATGPGRHRLATIPFRAISVGELRIASDSADELPQHEPLLFGQSTGVTPASVRQTLVQLSVVESLLLADDQVVIEEDSVEQRLAVLDNDTVSGAAVITSVEMGTSGGQLVVVEGGRALEFTPVADFVGEASFRYTVTDGGRQASATVVVRVEKRWHNAMRPADVDEDGLVIPRDALLVINAVNQGGSRRLPGFPEAQDAALRLVDVNNDGWLTPADALLVINHLNQSVGVHGEGEYSHFLSAHETVLQATDWLALEAALQDWEDDTQV